MEPALTALWGPGFTSSSKPDWGSFVATKRDRLLGLLFGWGRLWWAGLKCTLGKSFTNHMPRQLVRAAVEMLSRAESNRIH